MPNFSDFVPQPVNIQGAAMPAGMGSNMAAASGAVGAPVNPTMSGLSQAGQQAQQALQGAQAKSALTDVQQKTRGMQASMLGALANLPPDQFEANKAAAIGAINKLNPSWQFDPNIDQQTAKMAAMSAVPVEQQPVYGLNQRIPEVMARLSGQQPPVPGQGTQPGQINQTGNQPYQVNPQALLDASAIPALKPVVDTALKVQEVNQNSPTAKKQAEQTGDAFQSQQEVQNKTNILLSNSEDMQNIAQEIIDSHPDAANSTLGLATMRKMQQLNPLANKDIDTNLSKLEAYSASNILPSIKQFLQGTGQVRTFEGLNLEKIFAYDPNVSLKANMDKWQVASQQIKMGQQGADNLTRAIQSGQIQGKDLIKGNPANQAQSALGNKNNAQQGHPLDGTIATNAKGEKLILKGGQWTPQ
jgi:hypothetical protein